MWVSRVPNAKLWNVGQQKRMPGLPSWLPKNTYFRVGCVLAGTSVFQGLSFANKLLQVQRMLLQVAFGAHQVRVTLARLSSDEFVQSREVLTGPKQRTMFIYTCTH